MFKFKNNTPEKGGAENFCGAKDVCKTNTVKKQISKLYASSVLGNLSLTGAWVAILAARGFSLVEIGAGETIFHIVSLIFEIPSGVLADVFGRRKMLIVSTVMRMIANVVMILSDGLVTVCVSIGFQALAYNFSSGTGDALAYDSLKLAEMESGFDKYNANQLIIYRLCSGISTLCAGFALFIGHRAAYGTDLITGVIQIFLLMSLYEVYPGNNGAGKNKRNSAGTIAVSAAETVNELKMCFTESLAFIGNARNAMKLMLCNSLVGAVDILLLFYLQARLTEKGLPEKALGFALLFMEMGGIVGSKLSVRLSKFPKISYGKMFAAALLLVGFGILAEHSSLWFVMALGGFVSAMADDALQVRTNAILQDMFPSEQRAALTSVESFSFSVIMLFLTLPAGAFFTIW